MGLLTVTEYLSSTAVQLASFPSGLWSLVSQKTPFRAPGKADVWNGVAQTLMGGLIGMGASVVGQNLQAKGAVAALTGSRLGLTEINWSSLGSALVTGAAVGASIGIATYIAREGYKARLLLQERNSPSSQTNVSLQKMTTHGADAWAINRILEKDPKAMPRVQAAVLDHTMDLTHTNAATARVHTAIALASAMTTQVGQFVPAVSRAKQDWYQQTAKTLGDSPSAKLLFDALPQMGALKSDASILDMHSSWATMVSDQMPSPDRKAFETAFSGWSANYFKQTQSAHSAVLRDAFDGVLAVAQKPTQVEHAKSEATQLDAMVASMLLDTPVPPKKAAIQEAVYHPSMELDSAP